jgi:3-isopropylmalate dehydrogenase
MKMHAKIAVIRGDGIGPEVVEGALTVLGAVEKRFGYSFALSECLLGGAAVDATGRPLPEDTVAACKQSDAVLMGAIGGPQYDSLPPDIRPEKGLLGLRDTLGLYANLRPVKLHKALIDASPLKSSIVASGIDLLFVRELTGGIYFGERGRQSSESGQSAFDTELYHDYEIERIGKKAFEIARTRSRKVCSVDKANVLESSRLWRETMHSLHRRNDDIFYEDMLVDNAAMQLMRNPSQFDVIVTSNMFGDILSDEASMLTGSIGMLPSASVGEATFGLYEPIHGSAPDIAGQDKANPLATILSLAMLLRYSLNRETAANAVEKAVESVLDRRYRTADIWREEDKLVGTREMSALVAEAIETDDM